MFQNQTIGYITSYFETHSENIYMCNSINIKIKAYLALNFFIQAEVFTVTFEKWLLV